ncbi:LysR family transcriptional regulator [Mycetocola spongiae]|uniref:LysR family transcriptional regulator n=1 Tax=Mycetocola spongiae TaxID=2859226 RepID=UPI001CF1A9B0|nr:LysR family transcriptional regulator [Mycetocola spongiae]UCR88165.1 LysR family transcriptional regulator [Mycetocola spongiae]
MDTRLLEIFLEVVKTGSFSAAARSLNYSQPSISGHIQALERELGVRLFTRVGQTRRLTEAGVALVGESAQVFGAVRGMRDRLRGAAGLGADRTLRVAAFPSARASLLPRAIGLLRAADPSLRVDVLDVEPPSAPEVLARGECDLALSFTYEPVEPSISIATTRLFTDHQVLLVPSDHPAAGRSSVSLRDVAEENWIAGCPVCRHAFENLCREQGFIPQVVCSTDDVLAVRELVASGVGVAVRPDLLGSLAGDSRTTSVPLYPRVERVVSASIPRENAADPALILLLDCLAGAARELGALPDL